MRAGGTSDPRRRRSNGPTPARAGTTLLVHDLKSLSGRLSALCQNLGERYEDPLFKETALDVLDDTAVHLHRLACDLRDHDDRLLVKLRLNLNDVLEAALADARPDRSGQMDVITEMAELPAIWGDGYLLRRAFACAIENSLEAMGGRGTLLLRTTCAARNGNRRATVEIGDDGPGMSAQFLQERLFRPFAGTKEGGLGLGVYTMKQVALLHDGSLRILSSTGRGTRVRFHFSVEDPTRG